MTWGIKKMKGRNRNTEQMRWTDVVYTTVCNKPHTAVKELQRTLQCYRGNTAMEEWMDDGWTDE